MYQHILIAAAPDGHSDADSLRLARTLASPDATIDRVTVRPARYGGFAFARTESGQAGSSDLGADYLAMAHTVASGVRQIAAALAADLIVLGATRRGPIGHHLTGDPCRELISAAPCAVAIAPPGYAHRLRLLGSVGFGSTPHANDLQAFDAACRLAGRNGAHLAVVDIDTEARGMGPRGPEENPARSEPVRHHHGVDVVVAPDATVDLLVVGAAGPGRASNSISRRLPNRGGSPLVVIPPEDACRTSPTRSARSGASPVTLRHRRRSRRRRLGAVSVR